MDLGTVGGCARNLARDVYAIHARWKCGTRYHHPDAMVDCVIRWVHLGIQKRLRLRYTRVAHPHSQCHRSSHRIADEQRNAPKFRWLVYFAQIVNSRNSVISGRSVAESARMMHDKIARRIPIALLVALLLAFAGIVCVFLFLAYKKTPQARASRNPPTPLVGTWIDEQGNVINIRSDGTARARNSVNAGVVGYFEWTLESGEFAFYQYKNKYNLSWFVRRGLMDDNPTGRFDVIEITDTQFKMSTSSGANLHLFLGTRS